jgi:hypothetical protein
MTTKETIYFTGIDGQFAEITGPSVVIDAMEAIFRDAGCRFSKSVESWHDGFYDEDDGRDQFDDAIPDPNGGFVANR